MPVKQIIARPLAAVMLIAGLATVPLAPLPAVAQSAASEAGTGAFSDEQIEAFVFAALRVEEIREDYAEALQSASTEEEQDRLIREGNSAMVAAVDETPQITVEDYITIGEAASADPELGQRILVLMQEHGASVD